VLKAEANGTTLSIWINGVKILETTDSTYSDGNPGIGTYVEGVGGNDHGWKDFTVTDGADAGVAGAAVGGKVTLGGKTAHQ
jgi:hypothetical protein